MEPAQRVVPVPIFDRLAPGGFFYGGQYLIEYEPDSSWFETSLTMAAVAVEQATKTEYHVFQHFPSEAASALARVGVDVDRAEREGLLRIVDSFSQTLRYEATRHPSARTSPLYPPFEGSPERPLDVAKSGQAWAERARVGYPEVEKGWLHVDDNTAVILQYNDEETVVDAWRTGALPFAVRARETPHFLAFPTGIASQTFLRKFETLCDGIIDLKVEESGGQLRSLLRIRTLRGRSFDSAWHPLRLEGSGRVTLGDQLSRGEERTLTTIMFTDLVGFTALAQQDEKRALELLARHQDLLRGVLPRFQGREIKSMGDGFLLEFPSALGATHCAVEFQRVMLEATPPTGAPGNLAMRVGVHLGDVVRQRGDLLGDAVNVASRIESVAEPGGVCISGQVYDQVRNKLGHPLQRLPTPPLKNVSVPVEIYKVILPWDIASGEGARAGAGSAPPR